MHEGEEDDVGKGPEAGDVDALAESDAALAKILGVIEELAAAGEEGSLEGLSEKLDLIEQISAQFGVNKEETGESLAGIRQTIASTATQMRDIEMALWAGDMERANLLQDRFEEYAATGLNEFGEEVDPDAEDADEDEDDEALNAELAELLAAAAASGDDEDWDDEDDDEGDVWDEAEDAGDDLFFMMPDEGAEDLFADLEAGEPGAVEALIVSGVDLNAPSGPYRRGAVLAALDAPGRSVEILRKLVEAGADPTLGSAGRDTVFLWAAGYHKRETVTAETERDLVRFLREAGNDLNEEVPVFGSALARAVMEGDAAMVAAMLGEGADGGVLLPRDFEPGFLAGVGLLAYAAPKPGILRILLEYGVDAGKPDAAGRLPADFVAAIAGEARARADADDPWTVAHAEALERSAEMLRAVSGA